MPNEVQHLSNNFDELFPFYFHWKLRLLFCSDLEMFDVYVDAAGSQPKYLNILVLWAEF